MQKRKAKTIESDEDIGLPAKIICSVPKTKCLERGSLGLCYILGGEEQCRCNPTYMPKKATSQRMAVHIDRGVSGQRSNRYYRGCSSGA